MADTDDAQAFAFVNTKGADLSVTKSVSGALGDKARAFGFSVTLTGDAAPSEVSYEKSDGTSGTLAVSNRKATFALSHGQTITLKGLPAGVGYVVSEEACDGYESTMSGAAFGTMGTENVAVTCENRYVISAALPQAGSCGLGLLGVGALAAGACGLRTRRIRRREGSK